MYAATPSFPSCWSSTTFRNGATPSHSPGIRKFTKAWKSSTGQLNVDAPPQEAWRSVFEQGEDKMEICRVINGMWQTSGGWGKIERDSAVEAMLNYADNGFTTFDMADHSTASISSCWSLTPFRNGATPSYIAGISGLRKPWKFPTFQLNVGASSQEEWANVLEQGEDKMEICRVVNGMWQTSGGWGEIDRDSSVEAMLKYADNGFTTFDMADIYGPAEDLYGIFINKVRRERPPEMLENIKGLTKWVPPPVKMTGAYVRNNIDISRKRMDVESLDMLQFHWWDYSNPEYLDALKYLTDLKEEGKIKMLALTNFDSKRLQIILENGIPIVSNQVQHSIVDMRPQKQMAELCQLTGVKLITYGTVMGGLLSEKFLDANISIPFVGSPLNTPSLQKYKRMVDAWGGWSLFQELLKTLKNIASKHAVSIPTVAVRYILDQPSVAGSMIGVRLGISEHINDSKAIFSLALDEEDRDRILSVTNKGRDLLKVIGDCGDEYR